MADHDTLIVRELGRADYRATWEAMRERTLSRDAHAPDEIWLLEHPPVYTLGLKCAAPTEATRAGIPLIKTDRGGDITYHGPGQAIVYVMIDLERRALPVRQLVNHLEQAVIELLAAYGVKGERRAGAPGVYVRCGADAQDAQVPREPGTVGAAKIASLGLRVRRGCSYHGLALNVDMDLAPFRHIVPCGLKDIRMTQLADLGIALSVPAAARELARRLTRALDAMRAPRHHTAAIAASVNCP